MKPKTYAVPVLVMIRAESVQTADEAAGLLQFSVRNENPDGSVVMVIDEKLPTLEIGDPQELPGTVLTTHGTLIDRMAEDERRRRLEKPAEDPWPQLLADIREEASKRGLSDCDLFVAVRMGLEAFRVARKLGAKFAHDPTEPTARVPAGRVFAGSTTGTRTMRDPL